jgi:hypothetical protein
MNGANTALRLPLALDHSASAIEPKAVPLNGSPAEDLERRIGTAAADAVQAFGIGLIDCTEGSGTLSEAAKHAGGRCVAVVARLQLAFFNDDTAFGAIVRDAGKRELWHRHRGALREHYGVNFDEPMFDRAIDEALGWVIDASAHVVAIERALAH